ncbi:unnamed protein product, partial [Rotaria sordida]
MSTCLDFLAPEVVNYEPLTYATDMWSMGVLIYVLVTGHTPFGGTTALNTQSNIAQCILDFPEDLFEKISKTCIDLIKNLIVRIPKHRITANVSLKHPWICSNEETLLKNSFDYENNDNDNNTLLSTTNN